MKRVSIIEVDNGFAVVLKEESERVLVYNDLSVAVVEISNFFGSVPAEKVTTPEAPVVSTNAEAAKSAAKDKPADPAPDAVEVTEVTEVSFETLRKNCTANIQRLALAKRARVVEILASFGVKKLPELSDEKLSELAVKLEEIDVE